MKHTVKKGETLSGIAKKYNTTVSAIRALNPIIKDVNKISVGWVLTLPAVKPPRDYTAIGKKLEECLNSMDNDKAIRELFELL